MSDWPEFLIAREVPAGCARPAVGVDGPVKGCDALYDHHQTGDAVNLLTVPDRPVAPSTVLTTMLDTDAIVSAAVVILRSSNQRDSEAVQAHFPVLYEASHYCDLLIPSGQHESIEEKGLALHCWLKEHGFKMGELLAWGSGEIYQNGAKWASRPSSSTQSRIFCELTRAVVTGVRRDAIPGNLRYMEELDQMKSKVRAAVRFQCDRLALIEPNGYIDPLALYAAIDVDVCISCAAIDTGDRHKYTVGAHPRAYHLYDLTRLAGALCAIEPGWGGRPTVIGSPLETGSELAPDDLVAIINRWLSDDSPAKLPHGEAN